MCVCECNEKTFRHFSFFPLKGAGVAGLEGDGGVGKGGGVGVGLHEVEDMGKTIIPTRCPTGRILSFLDRFIFYYCLDCLRYYLLLSSILCAIFSTNKRHTCARYAADVVG